MTRLLLVVLAVVVGACGREVTAVPCARENAVRVDTMRTADGSISAFVLYCP